MSHLSYCTIVRGMPRPYFMTVLQAIARNRLKFVNHIDLAVSLIRFASSAF